MTKLQQIYIEAKLFKWLQQNINLQDNELSAFCNDVVFDYIETTTIKTQRLLDVLLQNDISVQSIVNFIETCN